MEKIKLNENIKVNYDGAKEPLNAKVTYISPKAEYNPPVMYSNEERERLVFRVEAMIEPVTKTLAIHPGQPINVIL